MTTSDEKVWQPTAVQNLVRYAPSGTLPCAFPCRRESSLEKRKACNEAYEVALAIGGNGLHLGADLQPPLRLTTTR